MQLKKTYSFFHLFLLLLLAAFYGINNYIWLYLNQRPAVDDEAVHLISALRYAGIISHPSLQMFSALLDVDKLYPPLFPFFAAIFGLPFSNTGASMIMSNMVLVAGIFICLYFIGLKIGDARLGLFAALILSLYPMFFQFSRMFMLETAVCFLATAAITVLFYSDGFKKRTSAVLFGVILGLGLLTKQTYVFYIAGPLLFVVLVHFFKGSWQEKGGIILNLFLSFAIGAAIACLWYVPNYKKMAPIAMASLTDPSYVPYDIPLFSLDSFIFYLRVLINDQVLFFFFVVLLIALPAFLKRKKDEFFFLFLVWIVSVYLIRTFVGNKFLYYTFPYLPAVAIITACGIMGLKRAFFKKVMIWLIVIVGFFQFFRISYIKYGHFSLHVAIHDGTEKDKKRMVDIFLFPMTDILKGVKYFPQQGDWKYKDILGRILKESCGIVPKIGIFGFDPNIVNKTDPSLIRYSNYAGSNFDGLNYYFLTQKIPYKVYPLNPDLTQKVNFIITPIELEKMDAADFKTPIRDFVPVEVFPMRDKSNVYLYKFNKIIPFSLGYTPQLSPEYKMSSARIDIHSADMKFAFKDVKSNGVCQIANWLPQENWTRNWITQMELTSNKWEELWIEFVPLGTGDMYIQFRGSLYPDNKANRHEVYVDDVAIEGKGLKIINGSFEDQNYLGNPVTWDIPVTGGNQTTEIARNGRSSMLIWHDSPLVKKIRVKAGVKYRLSAWFKPYNPV